MVKMEILFFGQLADMVGKPSWQTDPVTDTDALKAKLEATFEGLQHVKYMIAVNRRMVQTNTTLMGSESIALMPPFSGG
jgi:molybdopterin converting factor small subunit